MGKALIIAEKPSVASDIAKAIGGFKKVDDYFESDKYVISSAVGHLLTIVPPPGVEAAKGKWTFSPRGFTRTSFGAIRRVRGVTPKGSSSATVSGSTRCWRSRCNAAAHPKPAHPKPAHQTQDQTKGPGATGRRGRIGAVIVAARRFPSCPVRIGQYTRRFPSPRPLKE